MRIYKNWLIFFNITFYIGLVFCIVGFNRLWMVLSGLSIMIWSRIEEERIKEVIQFQ